MVALNTGFTSGKLKMFKVEDWGISLVNALEMLQSFTKPPQSMQSQNVTRMWNMISSPATPTVCLEQKSENFQSRNVTLSMPSQSKK